MDGDEEGTVSMWRGMGVHVGVGYDGDIGQPTMMVGLDLSLDDWRKWRAKVGPDCLMVVRWYEGGQPLGVPLWNAASWFNRRKEQMFEIAALVGPRVVFSAYNEIDDKQAAEYAVFEAERLRLMHYEGLRGGVGNFSAGTPKVETWPKLEPMLDAISDDPRTFDLFCFHEYVGGKNQVGNPWHVGRFALPDVAPYTRGHHIGVTETGLDHMEDDNLPESEWGHSGWRLYPDARQNLMATLGALGGRYAALQSEGWQIEGAAAYHAGVPGWDDFDVSELLPFDYADEPEPDEPDDGWRVENVATWTGWGRVWESVVRSRAEG